MSAWLIDNMIWASAMMLLVLAIRRPAAHLFGAGPAYALWIIPLLRLVMPPLPAFGAELPALLPAPSLILALEETAAPLPPDGGSGQWMPLLLALWAGGAAVFLVWQWRAYRDFLTRLSLSSRSLGGHRGLPLIESAAVEGPVALGLLDRRIVVPADFGSLYSAEEQRLALDHETIHHRRGDIWCNLAALAVLALNWFNPVAWFAFRAFRADQELACDAAVAATAGTEARHDYACALIKSASRHGMIAACPLNHADQLKRRLKMMKDHNKSRLRLFGGGAAVAVLAAASATLGSPGLAHPHPEGEGERRSERVIIMNHKAEGGEHRAHGDRTHMMRIRRGADGELVAPDCDGGEATNVEEGSGNERTRVVLCSRGNANSAERAERLQRARDRLAGDTELSAETRARITASLDREIARLRGQ